MKKLLCAVATLFAITTSSFAQEASGAAFGKGSSWLGLGVGFGMSYNYYGSVKQTPAVALIYDRGIKDNLGPGNLGIGAIVGYKGARYEYPGTDYKATWTNIIIAARATYHFKFLASKMPKLDPYGGVMAGVRILKWKDSYYDQFPMLNTQNYGSAYAATGLFVGARYNFSPKVGAFAELGYDIAFFKLGVHANL